MTDLPAFARFWMVCRKPTGPSSRTAPTQRYATKADALAAAIKLAAETGHQFHVLETVATARPGDPAQETLL